MIQDFKTFKEAAAARFSKVSADTLEWIAIIVLHSATIPSLLAVMAGLTDRMPSLDLVLLVWTGLTLLFVKSAIRKDMMNLITIGLGFIAQSMIAALIFFR